MWRGLVAICILCSYINVQGNDDFDAIKEVHNTLDEDHDGTINVSETTDYVNKELKENDTSKQTRLHGDDENISITELWDSWKKNPVYNWSVADVVTWLINTVKLPMYRQSFIDNKVTGRTIPRLATGKSRFVQDFLKITNPTHRRKIYLKASDIILFGPPIDARLSDKSFVAVRAIHASLDDDNDGEIGSSHVTLDQMWHAWITSEVCKWSSSRVLKWLKMNVDLPKYDHVFREKKITGKFLPRLFTDSFLKDLGINDTLDKKKFRLRTTDLILFGDDSSVGIESIDQNFLAIKAVHEQLDDDKDGQIDAEESSEYMGEELAQPKSSRPSQLHIHDAHITVDELWKSWQNSTVSNWTMEEVVHWLKVVVRLPQYEDAFRTANINGKLIPRLTDDKFLKKDIGISDSIHRRKIGLRCSDIILFGVPEASRYFNDYLVMLVILVATLICLYSFHEKNRTRKQIEQMTKDLEFLQQAEDNLKKMQEGLASAESTAESDTTSEREQQLREEVEAAKRETELLRIEKSGLDYEEKKKLINLEQELSDVRQELAKKQVELSKSQVHEPKVLQKWLVMTYKKEAKSFQARKQQALKQMTEAKEACTKISKTRRSMFGVLRLAHGESIDDVDHKILNARSSLAEITNDLQERQHRWKQIESLLNFPIVTDALFQQPQKEAVSRKSSIAQALAEFTSIASMSESAVAQLKRESSTDDDTEVLSINSQRKDTNSPVSFRSDVQNVKKVSPLSRVSTFDDDSDVAEVAQKSLSRSGSSFTEDAAVARILYEKKNSLTDSIDNKNSTTGEQPTSLGMHHSPSEPVFSVREKAYARANTAPSNSRKKMNASPFVQSRALSSNELAHSVSLQNIHRKANNGSLDHSAEAYNSDESTTETVLKKKKGFSKIFRRSKMTSSQKYQT